MPKDVNQLAKRIVEISTGKPVSAGKNPAAVALVRLGGLKGGKLRAERLDPPVTTPLADFRVNYAFATQQLKLSLT